MSYLVLIRHGESVWNARGLWTGLTDIALDEKGRLVARKDGQKLQDMKFDLAYTSKLKRAQETLTEIKKQLHPDNLQVVESSSLNERDYGDFTGKNKWEIQKEFGEDQFLKWRRGWNEPIPGGETLKDVYGRVVPFYKENILPNIATGKNILVVAHGNSLRALVKFLEGISDENISKVEIATGEIYLYQLDDQGQIVSKQILKVNI